MDDGEDFIDWKRFNEVVIGGKPINSEMGEKSRFFGFDDDIVSVEKLVIQYFAMTENGKWNGIHCESSIYRMIFTVFLWNVIFCGDIPFVFQTEYQNAPLDMGTEWFYVNRKEIIEQRVAEIAKFGDEDIESVLEEIYEQHGGESVVGIYWDRFQRDDVVAICKGIGGMGIGKICLLLSTNYRFWSGGLPDLMLWREVDDGQFECKIVEVKGPRDHLSEKQICWIRYLQKTAALDVAVARVKEQF